MRNSNITRKHTMRIVKILAALVMVLMINTSLLGYDSIESVEVIDGKKYVKVHITCTGGECTELGNKYDLVKLRTIAKLKSVKSWSRLIRNNNLAVYKIEYFKDVRVITFIICNSTDSKLIDNSYGIEILYRREG